MWTICRLVVYFSFRGLLANRNANVSSDGQLEGSQVAKSYGEQHSIAGRKCRFARGLTWREIYTNNRLFSISVSFELNTSVQAIAEARCLPNKESASFIGSKWINLWYSSGIIDIVPWLCVKEDFNTVPKNEEDEK